MLHNILKDINWRKLFQTLSRHLFWYFKYGDQTTEFNLNFVQAKEANMGTVF